MRRLLKLFLALSLALATLTLTFFTLGQAPTAARALGHSGESEGSVQPAAPQTTVCASPGAPIPDNSAGGVTSTLTFTGEQRVAAISSVYLSATHTWVGDLAFALRHVESGERIVLVDRPGYPATQFGCGSEDVDVTLVDWASSPVEEACAANPPALQGYLRPHEPFSNTFRNLPLSGTWQLRAADLETEQTGTLDEWCLELSPATPIPMTKTVGVEPGSCATTSEITVTWGTRVVYCYQITNNQPLTFVYHTLDDSQLGSLLSYDFQEVGPGETFSITRAATIYSTTFNTATWIAEPYEGEQFIGADAATVYLDQPSLIMTKTVGVEPSACAETRRIVVPESGTDVVYCYRVRNTSTEATLLEHQVVDTDLGVVYENAEPLLEPGASFAITVPSTVFTHNLNAAQWTAVDSTSSLTASDQGVAGVVVGELPVITKTLDAAISGSLRYTPTSSLGLKTWIEVPPGALDFSTTFTFTPHLAPNYRLPPDLRYANYSFELTAQLAGDLQTHYLPLLFKAGANSSAGPGAGSTFPWQPDEATFTFDRPVLIVIEYDERRLPAEMAEESLVVHYWTGTGWEDAASTCGPDGPGYTREPENDRLAVAVCHLSEYAFFGE